MLQELNGKVVYVTGGARRVGRGIVLGFAAQGAHVVIHHSSSDADAEQTAADARTHGVETLIVKGDNARHEDIARMFAEAHDRFGRLDVLVNSAANFEKNPLLDIPPDEWDKVIGVNLSGPFWCTQHAGRLMRAGGRGGCIINIADNSGLQPWVKRPHHSISKAGLIMLTEVTARSLAPENIRANCLVLGPVLKSPGMSDDLWTKITDRLPIRRSGDPDDVARAAVFVATNDFINGAILHVDGGERLTDSEFDPNES